MEVPVTEAQQRRFYFPVWNTCAVANGWFMVKGRLRADLAAQREEYATWSDPAREVYLKVLTAAEQLALADHTAVVADHLRRGCNLVASAGRHASSGDLTNAETNRVAALFKLLTDPEDLEAVMNWLHPENAEKGSFVSWLKKQAHEGVLIAISRNAFDTPDWESLPIEKLRWLCKQLKSREPRSFRTGTRGKTFYRRKLAAIEERHESGRQYDPANAVF